MLLPLLVGEMVNINAHGHQFLPLELHYLFGVVLLHLLQ